MSDIVTANLDGVDVDSGTASEIGYAAGRGIPIFGYRTDFRLAGDNIGSLVNLQVESFITGNGRGHITSDLEEHYTRVSHFITHFKREDGDGKNV